MRAVEQHPGVVCYPTTGIGATMRAMPADAREGVVATKASGHVLDAVRESLRLIRSAIGAATINPDLLTAAERIPIEHALAAVRRLAGEDDHHALVAAVAALNAATEEFAARRMNRGVGRVLTGRSVDALG